MKNKKIVIIGLIFLIGIVFGIITYFLNKETKQDNSNEFEEKELIIKESYTIYSDTEINIKNFFENPLDLNEDAQITYQNIGDKLDDRSLIFKVKYYNSENVEVYEEEALDNNELKDGYLKKEVVYSIGKYSVKILNGNKEYNTILTVIDKTKPEVEVKDIEIKENEEIDINDFIVSCVDNSLENCNFKIKDDKKIVTDKVGSENYTLIISDNFGNEVEKEVTLKITKENDSITSDDKNTTNSNKNNTSNNTNKNNTNNNTINTNNNSSDKNNTNNNTSNNESNNKNNTTKKVVSQKEEYGEEEITIKYGTKIITKPLYKVTTYSDNSTEKTFLRNIISYDYSTFNATTNEMKNEAIQVVNNNNKTYNELLNYVNLYRNEVNKTELVLDNELSIAATIRAIEMAYADKFAHIRPNGENCFSVYNDLNIITYAYGENIAMGYQTTKAVSEGWKNSQGHYANMISDNFAKIGFGMYKLNNKIYWVQLFGK